MSLQERTLVVRNFDPDKTTQRILKELCLQAGPVRNVVVRQDHAFVEFEDVESVGFAKALLDGVILHKKKLNMEPRLKTANYYKYTRLLQDYIKYDKLQRTQQNLMLQPVNGFPQAPAVFMPVSSVAPGPYQNQPLVNPPVQVYANQLMQQMPVPPNTSPWEQQRLQPQMAQVNSFIQAPNYMIPVATTPANYVKHNHNEPALSRQHNFPRDNRSSSWSNRRR